MIAIKVIFKIPADKIEEGKAAYISRQNEVTKEEVERAVKEQKEFEHAE
jgi:hypothetical protein